MGENNKKIPVIYIVGSGHCGSTLLDIVLDSHSQIVGVGELYQYGLNNRNDLICTCGKKVSECDFWKNVFKDVDLDFHLKVFRPKKDFLFNKDRFFELDEKGKVLHRIDVQKYLEVNEKIFKNILKYSNKKIVLESSKDPDRLELLLKSDKLDILLLHLVRDGRAVYCSYKKIYKGIKKPVKGDTRWLFKNLKTEIIKKRNKAKSVFIKYEDFCKNPQKSLELVLHKIDLNFESEMLNFRDKIHHQVGGNHLRFSKDKEIKLDSAWKKEFRFSDQLKFLPLTWLNWLYKIKKSK